MMFYRRTFNGKKIVCKHIFGIDEFQKFAGNFWRTYLSTKPSTISDRSLHRSLPTTTSVGKGTQNAFFQQTSTNTTYLLQWVNSILFLLHQRGNDEPRRKITSKMEEQQTWGIEEEKTLEDGWRRHFGDGGRKNLGEGRRTNLGWRKNKLLSTSLTTSTPLSPCSSPTVVTNQPSFLSLALKHPTWNCAKKKFKLKK